MRETQSDFHERLSAAWREAIKQAQDQAARQKQRTAQTIEERCVRLAMIALWIAGLASCLVLSWWLSAGNLLLTGATMLLPIGAWVAFGWYRWALLLPLSLIGLLALIGASRLW